MPRGPPRRTMTDMRGDLVVIYNDYLEFDNPPHCFNSAPSSQPASQPECIHLIPISDLIPSILEWSVVLRPGSDMNPAPGEWAGVIGVINKAAVAGCRTPQAHYGPHHGL